eukprot:CAMPEP_0201506268 /NCGR_PEP_ID=MMETSP0161_2-20130828/196_1 /ASSEMBLY_ACC=CAM_ASM_000251 /TAXON_ID=180227 /ORGANISM="Neoparamoeba aestuarina, Strain SoJaBio B1-5/56/2" /LENGTH=217 /DNA_ID=CAMNT_0047900309 /DNA_START=100 /DNA_END=753 /DNA_ORIENTATION=+
MATPFQIIYHKTLTFRAAPIQMILLHVGQSFEMIEPTWHPDRCLQNNPGYPAFAPPVLVEGSFTLGQTNAIVHYLGRKFHLGFNSNDVQLLATTQQLVNDVGDLGSELFKIGKDAEEKKKWLSEGEDSRLHKWLVHLDKAQQINGKKYFQCDEPTEVDFSAVVAFDCLDYSLGEGWRELASEGQRNWYKDMTNLPFYEAYTKQATAPILFESYKPKE